MRSEALPITRLGGAPCGVLAVYAREPGCFGEREVELLDKTAMDVSFALDHLEQETRRRRAEEDLRQAEAERQRLEVQLAQAQ
jgi:GAF domain-containing protein